MRSSLTRGVIAKALMTVATAALLAGCSNSIERFQSAYDNPSDADPVYTASVPRPKKISRPVYKKPRFEQPSYEAAADDIIEETPIKRAAVPMAKPKDYASVYKPAYKQPTLKAKKPRLILPVEDVAETETDAEEYVAPVSKKKIKFNQSRPVVEDEVADVAPVVTKPAKFGAVHTVASGETLYSLGRKYGVSPFAISDANRLDRDRGLMLGQKIKIPGSKAARPVVEEETVVDNEPVIKPVKLYKKAPLSLTEEQQEVADAEVAIGEKPKKLVAAVKPKVIETPTAEAPTSPAGLNLRWPLKGKVISGFGNKPGGLKNEGINIAVPEGTSIRAADGGVVAYAGNELKGYGNLVLIRHPGGYVTAYAHAKELFVKRGDKIERGAVIAKAGQTGSVSSPQLHFEVRKGATALDPNKYLASTTASN